jgi:hypothetical protein
MKTRFPFAFHRSRITQKFTGFLRYHGTSFPIPSTPEDNEISTVHLLKNRSSADDKNDLKLILCNVSIE